MPKIIVEYELKTVGEFQHEIWQVCTSGKYLVGTVRFQSIARRIVKFLNEEISLPAVG